MNKGWGIKSSGLPGNHSGKWSCSQQEQIQWELGTISPILFADDRVTFCGCTFPIVCFSSHVMLCWHEWKISLCGNRTENFMVWDGVLWFKESLLCSHINWKDLGRRLTCPLTDYFVWNRTLPFHLNWRTRWYSLFKSASCWSLFWVSSVFSTRVA